MIRHTLTLLILLMTISLTAQSPWTPGVGGQFHQVSFTYLPEYDQLHTSGDPYQLERFITDITLQYYGEIGLGKNFSLTGIVPFKFLKSGKVAENGNTNPITQAGNFNSVGDIKLALKYQLFNRGGVVVAASVLTGLPTSGFDPKTGLRSGFDALNIQPSLSVGTGRDKFYTYGYLGYSYYDQDFPATIFLGAEFGWKFNPATILAAHFSTVQTIEDGENMATATNLATGLFLNGFAYTAVELKLIKELLNGKLGLVITAAGGVGELVARTPAFTFGMYTKI